VEEAGAGTAIGIFDGEFKQGVDYTVGATRLGTTALPQVESYY
jgi:hypothetical protein